MNEGEIIYMFEFVKGYLSQMCCRLKKGPLFSKTKNCIDYKEIVHVLNK